MLVRFNAVGTTPETRSALSAIEERLAQAPAGVRAYMTGDGPILAATRCNKSVDRRPDHRRARSAHPSCHIQIAGQPFILLATITSCLSDSPGA